MSRFVLLFLKLHVAAAFPWQPEKVKQPDEVAGVSATLLRGVKVAKSSASSNASAASTTSRVENGVELYGKECVDCIYNSAQCGCEPAMGYLACLTKHCYKSDEQRFVKMCSVLQGHCFSELDIECRGPETTCSSKFNQPPAGGLGLTWDPTALFDNAFCGPFGKCIGDIHMHVTIHNRLAGAGPKPKETPCGKLKDIKPAPQKSAGPVWLECGIPLVANAKIDKRRDWIICSSEVKDDKADCKVPMAATLAAQHTLESYCVLTDGKDLKKLTQPVWRNIKNAVPGLPAATAKLDHEKEPRIVTMEDAEGAIDSSQAAGGEAFDSMKQASQEQPVYMKDSDSERKIPSGRQFRQEANKVKRGGEETVHTVHRAGHEQNEKVRGEVEQVASEADAEVRQPIVKEVSNLRKGAKAGGVEVAADASQASNEAGREAQKVSDASNAAAQQAKQAAQVAEEGRQAAKPPWQPEVRSIVNHVVQSPTMTEFA